MFIGTGEGFVGVGGGLDELEDEVGLTAFEGEHLDVGEEFVQVGLAGDDPVAGDLGQLLCGL